MAAQLLPSEYAAVIRREKFMRLLALFFGILLVSAIIGIIFMLPSYFMLTFSKAEVLRRLEVQKEAFAHLDAKTTENRIRDIHRLAETYYANESRRKPIHPIFEKIAFTDDSRVRLENIELKQENQKTFVLSLQGFAATREDFLAYVAGLRDIDGFEVVRSPLSNLLNDEDVSFELEVELSSKLYQYAKKP